MRVGDLITSIADVPLADLTRMADVQAEMKVGNAMTVHGVRDRKPTRLVITPVQLGDFLTASTKYNLGYLYLERLRQPEKAGPWLLASVDEYHRALLRETSATPDIREGLAYAAGALGTCGYLLGDIELQERGCREGALASEENVRANPRVPRYRSTLAVNLANLSTFLQQAGKFEEAETRCREAAEHLQIALDLGGNLPTDRYQLVQVLMNLALITDDLRGPEAAVPLYDAAAPLHESASLPQSLSLALAKVHRNRASSLRKASRFEEAADAYDKAHHCYEETLSETDPVPVCLFLEAAPLECWRAASLCIRQQDQTMEAVLTSFENRVATLQASEDGVMAARQARAAAVEAFADAAIRAQPLDRRAGEVALSKAAAHPGQLQRMNATNHDDSTGDMLIERSDILFRSGSLRFILCTEDRATAWRHLADYVDTGRIDELPLETRLDLAASLLVADERARFDVVVASFTAEVSKNPRLLSRARESIKTLRRCGMPSDTTALLEEALHVSPQLVRER